mgnify:CR=1 FL=1
MAFRTLIISNECYLSIKQLQLQIKQTDNTFTIPLEDILCIVIDNYAVSMSANVLVKCAKYNIIIISCDEYHMPNGIFYSYLAHSRQSLVIDKQLKISQPFKKKLWQQIIKQKIINQAKVLENLEFKEVLNHYREILKAKAKKPILIGHSMGGMVVQKFLERQSAPGVVLMSSVPPQGLLGSAFGLAFSRPHLLGDLNRIMGGSQPQIDTLRHALFHEAIELERLQRYYHLCQPESHRAIWDMSLFDLPLVSRMQLPPMLVLGAENDVLIPPDQVRMTARRYGAEAHILPGLGHGMMMESDWRVAADPIVAWLKSQDL